MAKIAFFTLNAYDMLTGGYEGNAVGGAQLQQILIGKELADRGHTVYFVEYDTDNKSETVYDGIQIIKKPLPTGSEPSRASTAIRGTWRVLRRIEPDVCYRRSLDFEMIPLVVHAQATNSRFVYNVAHNDELTSSPHKFSTGVKSTKLYRWLNRLVLSATDAVIVQNTKQASLGTEHLKTNIHQIPNCYPSVRADPIDWQYDSPVVFWAARFVDWKRPQTVFELAESLPHITFVMAGDVSDNQFMERAAGLDNLELLGHVPFSEIDRYFAAADLFLNTSEDEGFPNTFLQAWANKTPVVSLNVDPSGIISSEGLGIVAGGSTIQLRDQIADLVSDDDQIQQLGNRSYNYLRENHSVGSISDRYERVLVSG